MRQKYQPYLLLVLNLICFSCVLSGQSIQEMEKPDDPGEELALESDRQFYCTGERIYFTAAYRFKYPVDNHPWSSVIYVELIRWNGEKIAQAKYKLQPNGASGSLEIPQTILSGNYYLRAYTKWMRNYPVGGYSYRLIKIMNPYDKRIDQGPTQITNGNTLHLVPKTNNLRDGIECSTDKLTYKKREKVTLTFSIPDNDDHSNYCVSVTNAPRLDTSAYYIRTPEKSLGNVNTMTYLPETRGLSISGKIKSENSAASSESPASPGTSTLYLSTPHNDKYFASFRAMENGSFYFTLPDFYGRYDFYIDVVLENGESPEILIDNDYCNRNIQLSYFPFSLDSAEMKIALEMAVNVQLSAIYNEEGRTGKPGSTGLPFYIKPDNVYYIAEFIQLPNLEEFFFELVKEVRTVRNRKQTSLKLSGNILYHNLEPLVLLDNIPVFNIDELLRIPLDRFEMIEILQKPYMASGIEYSGIICITTKRKDFAGINLNKSSQFFSFDLLCYGNFNPPVYSSSDSNRVTHRNNLLFWDPDIELTPGQPQTLSFYTSDTRGEHIVYVRSINERDKPRIYGSCRILVE